LTFQQQYQGNQLLSRTADKEKNWKSQNISGQLSSDKNKPVPLSLRDKINTADKRLKATVLILNKT
jgi:hypothetical protein